MSTIRDDEIWAGVRTRMAGVEAFVHPAPPWTGARRDAVLRRGPAMGPTLVGRERWRERRRMSPAPTVMAIAAVIALLVGVALLVQPSDRFGVEPSPSLSASPSPTASAPEITLPPETTTYRSAPFGYSIDYPFAWSVIEEPFGAGSPGVVELFKSTAGTYVSVGTATDGPPDLCTGCGRLESKDLAALGEEVVDTLVRTRTGGPYTRKDVAVSATSATLDGRPARRIEVVFPDQHGTTEYVLVAADGPRRIVIAIVPDFPDEPDEAQFETVVSGFRFVP
jgi:hypothetical protein